MDALVGDGVKLIHNGKLLETMDALRAAGLFGVHLLSQLWQPKQAARQGSDDRDSSLHSGKIC